MNELHIVNRVEKRQCLRLMKAMDDYGGVMIDPTDREQVDYHMDQMYVDYKIGEHIITLHYEHYTGVYLLSDTADEKTLQNMWDGIKPLVK